VPPYKSHAFSEALFLNSLHTSRGTQHLERRNQEKYSSNSMGRGNLENTIRRPRYLHPFGTTAANIEGRLYRWLRKGNGRGIPETLEILKVLKILKIPRTLETLQIHEILKIPEVLEPPGVLEVLEIS